MNDLISRQAAIDAIGQNQKIDTKEYTDGYIDGRYDAINAIKELPPSAQPEQRWIPCSERLPEEKGRYLVTRGLNACNSIWDRVYIVNYSDLMGMKPERIWWCGNTGKPDFQRIDDVIAWQPLPEPYQQM